MCWPLQTVDEREQGNADPHSAMEKRIVAVLSDLSTAGSITLMLRTVV